MLDTIDTMTQHAHARYNAFLDGLKVSTDRTIQTEPTNITAREETIYRARDTAASYLADEQGHLNDDSADVARAAHSQAMKDMGLADQGIDNRFAEFIFTAAAYTARLISAQVERDTIAVAQHMRTISQRVDMYVRSGRYGMPMAVAQVLMDGQTAPVFSFVDRIGRSYKSTKHVRDLYRQHLLLIYNEVYLDAVAEHGGTLVYVTHPDPQFKWQGAALSLFPDDKNPFYYDVRDEVFHPSSRALVTAVETP